MINTRLNELQGYKTSYLVNAKTVSGEPVLKLDRDCDGQVAAHEPVLVVREDSKSDAWRPLKSVDDLKKFLEATPAKEIPTLRGGKKLPKHAETLWNTEKFHNISTKDHHEHDAVEYTAYHYTKVDPARVQIGSAETPAGTVATFEEPQVVSRTHVEQVTCFARDGNNWVPMAFKDTDYVGYLD